jgi:signal transduction histidine kinase
MLKILKRRWGLTVSLVIFIFLVMVAAMLLVGLPFIILHHVGVLDYFDGNRPDNIAAGGAFRAVSTMLVLSAFLGTVIAVFFSKKALRPIRKIIEATHKVAGGDFNVRLDIHSIYELEELSQSFNKMVQELSTIETLRSDFINNISHEFKTPIVSISGFAKLLKDENLSESEQHEYLDIMIAESERLTTLSTNVLNLTKYESLEIVPDITGFRLDEQLRRVVIQLEPKWAEKNIRINIDANDVVYNGSSDLIQQVLLNLIDNAIKFTGVGGAIAICLSQIDSNIILSVKDEGIGMAKNTQAHIFDKFYQEDSSRTKEGNGLGLSIIKRIVDLCSGRIEIYSEPGKGSEFVVLLPVR